MTNLIERVRIFCGLVGRWYWAQDSLAGGEGNFRIDPGLAWELAGILVYGP